MADVEYALVGTFEHPADESVWTPNRTLVVAARGPFGIVRAIQVGVWHTETSAAKLKDVVARHVGMMTEGVYWSQHVYEGTPWYATTKEDRDTYNGIWLWKWKEPDQDQFPEFLRWDHRLDYGDKRWTALTRSEPIKLADLPVGM